MPFSDPAKRRKAQRDSKARARTKKAALRLAQPGNPVNPGAAVRLGAVVDVKALLEEQIENVRSARYVDVVERARAIGYLLQIGLRAVEAHDLERRLEALEAAIASQSERRAS
jgi:hypothetical protein